MIIGKDTQRCNIAGFKHEGCGHEPMNVNGIEPARVNETVCPKDPRPGGNTAPLTPCFGQTRPVFDLVLSNR